MFTKVLSKFTLSNSNFIFYLPPLKPAARVLGTPNTPAWRGPESVISLNLPCRTPEESFVGLQSLGYTFTPNFLELCGGNLHLPRVHYVDEVDVYFLSKLLCVSLVKVRMINLPCPVVFGAVCNLQIRF